MKCERGAYITELHGVGLGQDNVWGVGDAGELQLLRPRAVQAVVEDLLGLLGFDHIHRPFCQPANASQPFQVRLVHVLQTKHGLLALQRYLLAQRAGGFSVSGDVQDHSG